VRKKIPECHVNDFTNSWADGRAVCHLTEALKAGAFPQPLNTLVGKPPLENATKGEDAAEKELGIPQILAPEDMVAAADELSTMTYISYFRDYDLNEGKRRGAELAAKTADPAKTHAWGPGLEGAETNTPTEFYIQAVNAAGNKIPVGAENFNVKITGPSGEQTVPVKDNGNGTYTARYTLSEPGNHTIDVQLKTKRGEGPYAPIQGSPFTVLCQTVADPKNTTVTDVVFTVQARNNKGENLNKSDPKMNISSNPQLNIQWSDNQNGTYTARFAAPTSGSYAISIKVGNVDIKGSPINWKC